MKQHIKNLLPPHITDQLMSLHDNIQSGNHTSKYVPIQYERSTLYDTRDITRGLYNPYDHKYDGYTSGRVATYQLHEIPDLENHIHQAIQQTFDIDISAYQLMGDFARISHYECNEHVRIHVDDYDQFNLGVFIMIHPATQGGTFVLNGEPLTFDVGDCLIFSNGIPHEVTPIQTGFRIATFTRFKLLQS